MRASLVIGNWKMNGAVAANAALLDALTAGWAGSANRTMAVCAPFPYLAQVRERLQGTPIAWGAQDVSPHASGAYTGDVAAGMIAEFGCTYVIVGHSERRAMHGESDAEVAAKAQAVLKAGMTPVVCVGETLAEREAGSTEAVVQRQLAAVIATLRDSIVRVVLAYEPVWAIGTGRTATPEQAQAVHARLRQQMQAAGGGEVPILYGGSVKGSNAGALFSQTDIDGGLVGGASLDAKDFLAIARA